MSAGGAFYVQKFHYIDPHLAYGSYISVEAMLSAIIGGMGTIFGPLLGAAVLQILSEVTRNYINAPGVSLIIYGALLVLIVMFMPRGIAGLAGGKR
jgi:branched-chain amino acid transport system permease protein